MMMSIWVVLLVAAVFGERYADEVCPTLFARDQMLEPRSLPIALQLEPTTTPSWMSYWQIVGGKSVNPLACLMIEGDFNHTIIHSASTSCEKVSHWNHSVIWPPFLRGGEKWFNQYTVFISTKNNTFSVQLNQRLDSQLIEYTISKITGIQKLDMTTRGPKVKILNLRKKRGCLILTNCDNWNGWNYLSINFPDDTLLLSPKTKKEIEVKVTLSNCFPEYQYGIYDVKGRNGNVFLPLEVSYSHIDLYHTLSTKVNSSIISLNTMYYLGSNCSSQWYLVGVKGADLIINCLPEEMKKEEIRQNVINRKVKYRTKKQEDIKKRTNSASVFFSSIIKILLLNFSIFLMKF